MVHENPVQARHHGPIRAEARTIEHFHAVQLRLRRHADHISKIILSRDDTGHMRPMLPVVLARTSESAERVDGAQKVRMREIDTCVQDRHTDSVAVRGSSRKTNLFNAGWTDLLRPASPTSSASLLTATPTVLAVRALGREDGTVRDDGQHGGVVLEGGQRVGVGHPHRRGIDAAVVETKCSAGVPDRYRPDGGICSLAECHDVVSGSLSQQAACGSLRQEEHNHRETPRRRRP